MPSHSVKAWAKRAAAESEAKVAIRSHQGWLGASGTSTSVMMPLTP
jgi:hypothetical protein